MFFRGRGISSRHSLPSYPLAAHGFLATTRELKGTVVGERGWGRAIGSKGPDWMSPRLKGNVAGLGDFKENLICLDSNVGN